MSPTRRQFFGKSACAAMSTVPVMNTLLNLQVASRVAAQEAPTDHRTLVCVFLNGGMDSFNWLVPRDAARHATYTTTRGNLALPIPDLLPLHQDGGDGQPYGIHPSCAGLQEMFNGMAGDTAKRRAAIVSNIGTLIQPVTKAQYLAESVPLPRALYSHADQIDQWQTSVPQGMTQLSGWAGRTADVLHSTVNGSSIAMNISLAGNSLWQVGNNTTQFVVTDRGALTFSGSEIWDATHPMRLKNAAHRSIIQQNYANLMQQSYGQLTKSSIELQEFFLQQYNSYNDEAVAGLFPGRNYVAQQFRAAVRMIALRQALGLKRQTIFIAHGGWDHHGELLETQAEMLITPDDALTAFQRALDQLGLQDGVITYSASDFGRTLRSNGRGTDTPGAAMPWSWAAPSRGGASTAPFPDQTLESNDGPRLRRAHDPHPQCGLPPCPKAALVSAGHPPA